MKIILLPSEDLSAAREPQIYQSGTGKTMMLSSIVRDWPGNVQVFIPRVAWQFAGVTDFPEKPKGSSK